MADEAPERIWIANATNNELYKPWFPSNRGQCVPYIRQDIADARCVGIWERAVKIAQEHKHVRVDDSIAELWA